MKQLSPAEFFRKAREARHDSLGLEFDLDSSIALAKLARRKFSSDASEANLRGWEARVSEVARMSNDNATSWWLAEESVRMLEAFSRLGAIPDGSWEDQAAILSEEERRSVAEAFRLELVAGPGEGPSFTTEEELA